MVVGGSGCARARTAPAHRPPAAPASRRPRRSRAGISARSRNALPSSVSVSNTTRGSCRPGSMHEDRVAAHAVQRLADDLAVLARERLHFGHIAGDQRGRAALRKPGGVDLLVDVAQTPRPIHHQRPGEFGALQDVGGVDVFGVERRVLAHQDHVECTQRLHRRLAQRVPAGRGRRARAASARALGNPIAQPQIRLLQIMQRPAARLGRQQHRQRGVLGVLDVSIGSMTTASCTSVASDSCRQFTQRLTTGRYVEDWNASRGDPSL